MGSYCCCIEWYQEDYGDDEEELDRRDAFIIRVELPSETTKEKHTHELMLDLNHCQTLLRRVKSSNEWSVFSQFLKKKEKINVIVNELEIGKKKLPKELAKIHNEYNELDVGEKLDRMKTMAFLEGRIHEQRLVEKNERQKKIINTINKQPKTDPFNDLSQVSGYVVEEKHFPVVPVTPLPPRGGGGEGGNTNNDGNNNEQRLLLQDF